MCPRAVTRDGMDRKRDLVSACGAALDGVSAQYMPAKDAAQKLGPTRTAFFFAFQRMSTAHAECMRPTTCAASVGGGCWQAGLHGDVLLYADGSARQALRFILTLLIERIRASVLDLYYTTETLKSTLCAVGEQQQKNKLR